MILQYEKLQEIVGVFFLTLMFLISGIEKIFNFKDNVLRIKNKLPFFNSFFYNIVILTVIFIEILSPLYLLSEQYVHINIALLITFTTIATLLFHFPPLGRDYFPFMSNLSTIGGLLILMNKK